MSSIIALETVREERTLSWWLALCMVALLNIGIWFIAARIEMTDTPYRSWQLVLSGIYVAVCAFRSAFPRVDLERRCLWDTPLSSIFVGRSVATLAELCFAMQCTLLLVKLGELTKISYLDTIAIWIVPIIVIAQLSCWYAVITLNHLGHVIEELLWTLAIVLLAAGFAGAIFSTNGALRIACMLGMICSAGATLLICRIDIPMYICRWQLNHRAKHRYLSLWRGFTDTLTRRHPTRDWAIWRCEVPWMSLYFSFGVWLSIGMTLVEGMVP